jgi:hypothetical protein
MPPPRGKPEGRILPCPQTISSRTESREKTSVPIGDILAMGILRAVLDEHWSRRTECPGTGVGVRLDPNGQATYEDWAGNSVPCAYGNAWLTQGSAEDVSQTGIVGLQAPSRQRPNMALIARSDTLNVICSLALVIRVGNGSTPPPCTTRAAPTMNPNR